MLAKIVEDKKPMKHTYKNRGSTINPQGRFEKEVREIFFDDWHYNSHSEEPLPILKTSFRNENAKTIITRNDSPDISFDQSINPYKGCEHGCIYCYARPSHAYMNLSPGLDFETKIFYKNNASELLEKEITKAKYHCQPIVIGANTDPYQPAESGLKITRGLIEIIHKYQHPIVIITKSSMVERDVDLLSQLAKKNLVKVAITLTTLDLSLKKILEPRASAPKARLRAMQTLSDAGIPIIVMAAPMIPMINDKELEHILREAKKAGARFAGYTFIRLPFEVKELFKAWLNEHFPERSEHVMSLIRQSRGGKEYDSTFGKRMHGEGKFADLLETRFTLACKKWGLNQERSISLETHHFKKNLNNEFQFDFEI